MLSESQRLRTLAGIDAALSAIKDNTPFTEEDRRQHELMVRRELVRNAKQKELGLD